MEAYIILAFVSIGIVLAVLLHRFRVNRARSIIRNWAEANEFRLLKCRYQIFEYPFTLKASVAQMVFKITVEDKDHNLRIGHILCGGAILGLASEKVKVKWLT